jgi:hypothetical protein
MIYVEKDSPTNVALTLTESSSLSSPFYLFEFVNEMTKETTLMSFADISGYPERYNLFVMDIDLMKGQYTYSVYESEDPDPEEIADTTGIVLETGIMIVNSDEDVDTDIYL